MNRTSVSLLGTGVLALAITACSAGGSVTQLPAPARQAADQAVAFTASSARADSVQPDGSYPAPTAPPAASGYTNEPVAEPAPGKCRAGLTYTIGVTSGPTNITPGGSTETFSVFEPSTLCAGKRYPVIFNGPGFGSERTTAPGSFASFNNAGYGVISVDQAGEGTDGGKIRTMDPDQEGVMLLAVMNWAQAKLSWLAYGPTNDGKDPHEPIFGSDGGSYGGMYQFMLLNVDKRHRLRAIVPQITPHDLNFSLYPGGVTKALWDTELFGVGQAAGSGANRLQFDPFVDEQAVGDTVANTEDSFAKDFYGYHSASYFCNGTDIATNGGAGTHPDLPPTTAPPKINALVWIGVRDTLFNFNNGYLNYKCLQRGGGDVRLFSYQTGHNALGTVPDPYVDIFFPSNDDEDARCGTLPEANAELAWFNKYLKGQTTSEFNAIPNEPCISFEAGDGIKLPEVPTLATTPSLMKQYDIGSANVVAGDASQVPTAVSLYTAPAAGAVEAGIGHISFDVAPTLGISASPPIIFVGIGQLHASNPAIWDLVDNEVTPLRGVGHYDLDLVGGGARLLPGDQLGVLFFGLNQQYVTTGNLNAATPGVQPITVTGKIYLPILPNIKSNV